MSKRNSMKPRKNTVRQTLAPMSEIDTECKAAYNKYFGISWDDTHLVAFTANEHIDLYAKNLLFWDNMMPDISPNADGRTLAKSYYVSTARASLKGVISKFDNEKQQAIYRRMQEMSKADPTANDNQQTGPPLHMPRPNVVPGSEKITHRCVPPKNNAEASFRRTCATLYSTIGDPHCVVCGDTKERCELINIHTDKGMIIMCVVCQDIQDKMQ